MKATAFAYHDPRTMDELLGLLGQLENVRLLAGGQSLVPMLNMRYAIPDHVVDLNRIPELAYLREGPDGIEIGAMARQRTLERDPMVRRRAPILAETLRWVGHVQTRSRGTFGGSLCHLDPAAELPGIAALYGATLHVAGPRGRRDVAMADWGLTYMTPNLEPDEALVGISLPVWREPHGYGFEEFARRHGDYAIVAASALLSIDDAGTIRRAAVSLVGIDVYPMRLEAAERALLGAAAGDEAFRAAAELARDLDHMSDAHITGDYRRRLSVALTRRALAQAAARARGDSNVRH